MTIHDTYDNLMEVQKFILDHENWKELLENPPYCLKITVEGTLILFNYSQLDSDFFNPIVKECRGLILDKNTYRVVCRAMDKFMNAEEGASDLNKINWSDFQIQTKIDGSLIRLYHYNGEWHVSTSGTIDAFNAPLNAGGYKTFGDLFAAALWKYINPECFYEMLDPTHTYWFELTSPYNRVVIPYDEIELTFLGWRANYAPYKEKWPSQSVVAEYIPIAKKLPRQSYQSLRALADSLPWNEEGFVICDNNFHRVKVKSPAWISAHYLRNNGIQSDRRLIDVILHGEQEELLTYAPEYTDRLHELQAMMEEYHLRAEELFSAYLEMYIGLDCPGRAWFAKTVKKNKEDCEPYLFWAFSKIYGTPRGEMDDNKDYSFKRYAKENLDARKWIRLLKLKED